MAQQTEQLKDRRLDGQIDSLIGELESKSKPVAAAESHSTDIAGASDALADQVQQLLDEAKTRQHDPVATGHPSLAAPDSAPAPGSAPGADEELQGDFESIDQVLGTASPPMGAPGPVTAAAQQQNTVAGDFVDPNAVAATAPPQVPPPAAVARRTTDFTATASDVAKELDQQPEARSAAAPAEIVAKKPETPRPVQEPSIDRKQPRANFLASAVHKVCVAVSLPAASLSDEWRNRIGYIGLVTLFNFAVLMIYNLCKSLLS